MRRSQNSTPATRAKNGRKRTAAAGIKISGSGTKAKRVARARARKAAHVKRHGATPPQLRVTRDTLRKFQPGQKRRRADPLDERFTATILSVMKASQGGGTPTKLAPLTGPRETPRKASRDRTMMRKSGMRFERDGNSPRGEWMYVDGTNGAAVKLGHDRVIQRRQLRQATWNFERDVSKLAEIGESVSRAAVGLGGPE